MADFYKSVPVVQPASGPAYLLFPQIPTFPVSADDWVIETKVGDRYDLLAYRYWSDVTHWRYIALVNNLPADQIRLPVGITIRIPRRVEELQNAFTQANKPRTFGIDVTL